MSTATNTNLVTLAAMRPCLCGEFNPCPHNNCRNCEPCSTCSESPTDLQPSAAIIPAIEIQEPSEDHRARMALVNSCQTYAARLVLPQITSPQSHVAAQELLAEIQRTAKNAEEKLKPWIAELDRQHSDACALRNSAVKPLRDKAKTLADSILAWEQAERERVAQEQRRIQSMVTSTVTRQASDEAVEQQLIAAIAADEAGNAELAQAILERPVNVGPVFVPSITVESTVQYLPGTVRKGTWEPTVESLEALVLSAADAIRAGDRSLLAFLCADISALKAQAKATKEQTRVPGVRVEFKPSLGTRKL